MENCLEVPFVSFNVIDQKEKKIPQDHTSKVKRKKAMFQ
jgi:hypothetical protein